jgi:modulator of FtsH protease HflC
MSHDEHSQSHGEHAGKRAWISVLVGIVILAVFILYTITFTVREGEYGVLKTFGKVTRTIEKPGLYWKFPLAQKAVIHDARLRTSEDGMLEQTFTRDGKPIIVMTFFTWRIDDVKKYDNSFGSSIEQAERSLQTIVRAAKGDVFGSCAFNDFITTETQESAPGMEKLRFESIEQKILQKVQEKETLSDFGISINQVGVKRLILPEAVSQKVFERMKSERQALAKKYISEGEGEAVNIRSRAERDRDLILYTAQARAKSIRAEGEKAAAGYYNVFAENPELHRFLKSLETIRLLAKKTTIIIDTSSPPFDLLGKDAMPFLKNNKPVDGGQ